MNLLERAYNNRIYFTVMRCGSITEYLVSLKLNYDDYDGSETRVFKTDKEALQCFRALIPYKHVSPQRLLHALNTYVPL